MITKETIARAALARARDNKYRPYLLGTHESAPGWITSGAWAARFDVSQVESAGPWEMTLSTRETFGDHLARWGDQSQSRMPVVEDVSAFIASVPEIEEKSTPCATCDQDGEHECSCGDVHDCNTCGGGGRLVSKAGRDRDPGQSVWRSENGVETIVDADFADLLRGYHVVRFAHPADREEPLLALDESGQLVAVVMPMRCAKRDVPRDVAEQMEAK